MRIAFAVLASIVTMALALPALAQGFDGCPPDLKMKGDGCHAAGPRQEDEEGLSELRGQSHMLAPIPTTPVNPAVIPTTPVNPARLSRLLPSIGRQREHWCDFAAAIALGHTSG